MGSIIRLTSKEYLYVKEYHKKLGEIHTYQSLRIKEKELHKIYEECRELDLKKDWNKIQELKEIMIDISSKIKNPKNPKNVDSIR